MPVTAFDRLLSTFRCFTSFLETAFHYAERITFPLTTLRSKNDLRFEEVEHFQAPRRGIHFRKNKLYSAYKRRRELKRVTVIQMEKLVPF